MLRTGANYQEMFKKVKNDWRASTRRCCEDLGRQGEQAGAHHRRHAGRDGRVRLSGGPQHHPQEARKALEKLLAEETKLDASARLKIASQRKIILEGSQSGTSSTASTTTMRSRSSPVGNLRTSHEVSSVQVPALEGRDFSPAGCVAIAHGFSPRGNLEC